MLILDLRLLLANITGKLNGQNVTQVSIERLLRHLYRDLSPSRILDQVAPLLDCVLSRQSDGAGESDSVFYIIDDWCSNFAKVAVQCWTFIYLFHYFLGVYLLTYVMNNYMFYVWVAWRSYELPYATLCYTMTNKSPWTLQHAQPFTVNT